MSGIGRPIVVLDFGAQYSKLIARRVREAHVYSIIEPFNISPEKLRALNPAGIILSGGPSSVHSEGSPKPHPDILQFDVPILGICYGVQIFADMLGGKVEITSKPGEGTTVDARIPVDKAAAAGATRAEHLPVDEVQSS